jgi:hypothetical protein
MVTCRTCRISRRQLAAVRQVTFFKTGGKSATCRHPPAEAASSPNRVFPQKSSGHRSPPKKKSVLKSFQICPPKKEGPPLTAQKYFKKLFSRVFSNTFKKIKNYFHV